MLTCVNCQREVIPIKKFNTGAFILLLVLGALIGGIAYLIYFSAKASTDCPVCREDVYGRQLGSNTEPKLPSEAMADKRWKHHEREVARLLGRRPPMGR